MRFFAFLLAVLQLALFISVILTPVYLKIAPFSSEPDEKNSTTEEIAKTTPANIDETTKNAPIFTTSNSIESKTEKTSQKILTTEGHQVETTQALIDEATNKQNCFPDRINHRNL
ncbi:Oidioi.mRNA.OKI2018_I69.PAR.g12955.t1.cds [Oikopleura dioica]|uniref:Oidioi.mRNA.OKI2018_I69.PAR.g12955.t1.cds n=1 Tax=Oikopleura dioica TaxID=34765 RepID=A0ABN7S5R7_OIKDI|nr:Oidioi.mRNA.OKI2018_I69.PAR.g12955.t1.cds [Oikopleura dioica]